MPTIDLAKRNALLRKYCPEFFEVKKKRKSPETCLQDEIGDYVDAIIYDLDEDGALVEAMVISNDGLIRIDLAAR